MFTISRSTVRGSLLRGIVLAVAAATSLTTATRSAAQDPDFLARQRTYYHVKPAVVLVSPTAETHFVIRGLGTLRGSIRGWGSGWIITPDGFLVTNGHVVALYVEANERQLLSVLLRNALQEAGLLAGLSPWEAEALVQATAPKIQRYSPIVRKLEVYLQNGQAYSAEIKQYSPPIAPFVGKITLSQDHRLESGKDVAVLKIEGRDFPTVRIGDSEALQIGANVYVAGYPGGVLQHGALNPATGLEASFTRGQISSLKMSLLGATVLQFDAAVGRGNSGGPVFNDRGEVVGMTTFGTLEESELGITDLQGFNFAVPTSSIMEFVRASGADYQQRSLFDRTWDAALAAYYERRRDDAIAAFDHALRLIPGLPDAIALRRDVMGWEPAPPPPPPPSQPLPWLPIALATLAVGALFWLALRLRARAGATPAGPRSVESEPAAQGASAGAAAPPDGDGRQQVRLPGRLVVEEGPQRGRTIQLAVGGIRIGRDPTVCQLVLTDGAVSREHVLVMPTSNATGVMVRNLSRTNPTLLNDQPVAMEASLRRGDRIRIGASVIVYDAEASASNGA